MMRIGLFSVAFHGPRKRSGGVTGQNSHPLSGSCVTTASAKRVMAMAVSCASMNVSGVGPENGRTSLHVTAERSRSTSCFSFTAFRIAVPLPAIAAAKALATSGQYLGLVSLSSW